jgi:RNA polymerase sigma-70 factor, ECF subfamily
MPKRSSEELLMAVGRGEERAFEELMDRHRLELINFFFQLIWDRHTAEDLAQEVFVRLYTSASRYKPTAKFRSYMYRVARSCWIDQHRRTKSRRLERSLDAESDSGASLSDVLVVLAEQPEESARKEEFVKDLVVAIDSLPTDHKVVFVLSQVEGLRYKEISEVLNIPEGTVKSRMFACLKKIRETLRVNTRKREE